MRTADAERLVEGGDVGRHATSAAASAKHSTTSGEKPEYLREPVAHLLAMDDGVDHPVLQQELAGLESLRELLPQRLLDHSRAGESDQRLRLGEDDVAKEGEIGRAHV